MATPTVLVVEDDRDFRELERFSLERHGYNVLTASNGAEALALLDSQRPCVILLDLMMPVMDGLTFLRRRADRNADAAGIPVVCVSAGGADMAREAVNRGAVDCMAKPLDLDELCGLVATYCDAH